MSGGSGLSNSFTIKLKNKFSGEEKNCLRYVMGSSNVKGATLTSVPLLKSEENSLYITGCQGIPDMSIVLKTEICIVPYHWHPLPYDLRIGCRRNPDARPMQREKILTVAISYEGQSGYDDVTDILTKGRYQECDRKFVVPNSYGSSDNIFAHKPPGPDGYGGADFTFSEREGCLEIRAETMQEIGRGYLEKRDKFFAESMVSSQLPTDCFNKDRCNIAFVGSQNSGKSTVASCILKWLFLPRGRRVEMDFEEAAGEGLDKETFDKVVNMQSPFEARDGITTTWEKVKAGRCHRDLDKIFPSVTFWDLPGLLQLSASDYFKTASLHLFSVVFLVCEKILSKEDYELVMLLNRRSIPFHIVRTKVEMFIKEWGNEKLDTVKIFTDGRSIPFETKSMKVESDWGNEELDMVKIFRELYKQMMNYNVAKEMKTYGQEFMLPAQRLRESKFHLFGVMQQLKDRMPKSELRRAEQFFRNEFSFLPSLIELYQTEEVADRDSDVSISKKIRNCISRLPANDDNVNEEYVLKLLVKKSCVDDEWPVEVSVEDRGFWIRVKEGKENQTQFVADDELLEVPVGIKLQVNKKPKSDSGRTIVTKEIFDDLGESFQVLVRRTEWDRRTADDSAPRTFAQTCFIKHHSKPPDEVTKEKLDEVTKEKYNQAVSQILQYYAADNGMTVRDVHDQLETMTSQHRTDSLEEIACRDWCSSVELGNKVKYCFILCKAICEDRMPVLQHAITVLEAMNPTRSPEGKASTTHRGGGFPSEGRYRDFFLVGRDFRQPALLATSTSQDWAEGFWKNACTNHKLHPVHWVFHFPEDGCLDVKNLHQLTRPGREDEDEFLFMPYSCFHVEKVFWYDQPDVKTPHKIELKVYHDSDTEGADCWPLAPWY